MKAAWNAKSCQRLKRASCSKKFLARPGSYQAEIPGIKVMGKRDNARGTLRIEQLDEKAQLEDTKPKHTRQKTEKPSMATGKALTKSTIINTIYY